MNRITSRVFFICLALMITIGCSSGCSSNQTNPLVMTDMLSGTSLPTVDLDIAETGRTPLGTWAVDFDVESLTATVTPERSLYAHWNVTQKISMPSITVNSWIPEINIINVDVTLANPHPVDSYDARLIIYSDNAGHRLLYPDNWTALYDIPGGEIINPFKAYAKSEPNRKFAAESEFTENMEIYLPGGDMQVLFAVDASLNVNCEEPYSIANFKQWNLYSYSGSTTALEVDVHDWQDDISSVNLHCPLITGELMTPYSVYAQPTWRSDIENKTGAPAGQYTGINIAESSSPLSLYDLISITVSSDDNLPSNPQFIDSVEYLYRCNDLAIQGDYAYLADEDGGFKIADISDTLHPEVIANIGIESHCVTVDGHLAAAAVDNGKLSIINVMDPYNPYITGRIEIPGDFIMNFDMEIYENHVYIAALHDGLIVVDISNPSDPHIAGSMDTLCAHSIGIQDDYVYLADSYKGLKIIDASDMEDMQVVGSVNTSDALGVFICGNLAYVADSLEGLKIIDVSNPTQPEIIGSIDTAQANDCVVDGNYAYVSDSNAGFKIVDIHDPFNPFIIGGILTKTALRVAVSGNYAYLADYDGGMKIIDTYNKTNPAIVSQIVAFTPSAIDIFDNHAFVSSPYRGLSILDVNNRTNPQYISALDLEYANATAVSCGYAYIANGVHGLLVVDISNISDPTIVGEFDTECAYDVAVQGNYAYLADRAGFIVIDIYNPGNPQGVAIISRESKGIVVNGNYAYLACAIDGFTAIDISNPLNPVIIGEEATPYRACSIDIQDDFAYVGIEPPSSSYNVCMVIIDISNPHNPETVGRYHSSTVACNVTIEGNFSYLTGANGLEIVDISDPAYPRLFSSLDTPGSADDVAVIDNYAYIADEWKGNMHIIKLWD